MNIVLKTLLFLTICTSLAYGQNSRYDFARDVFKHEYKKKEYETFKGRVEVISENTLRFGGKILLVDIEDDRYIPIFTNGILHPEIIGGKHTVSSLRKSQLDTMSNDARVFYELSRNDSIKIGSVEQLEDLDPNSRTKRFVFWLYRRGLMNPIECYFELYNDKGTTGMKIEEFISNCRLTFYHRGSIIL